MAKLKVQDLPKEEQEKLIHEANEVGIRGILTAWGVETLKEKIAEKKANVGGEQTQGNDEQNAGNDEQTGENVNAENPDTVGQGEGEQTGENETQQETPGENEQNENPDTVGQNEEKPEENENSELPPETPDDVKAFLNGETEETPEGTEEISENEAEKLQQTPAKKGIKNGICHICRSQVIDGKCTGCGYEVAL